MIDFVYLFINICNLHINLFYFFVLSRLDKNLVVIIWDLYYIIKYNLKYYKTAYVPRLNTDEENIQENLLVNIKNLIQLENGISIDDKRIKVILSEDEIDKFSENTEQIKECEKLYISSDILLTAKQVKIFKDNNIEVFIIPEYYFDEEIKGVQ